MLSGLSEWDYGVKKFMKLVDLITENTVLNAQLDHAKQKFSSAKIRLDSSKQRLNSAKKQLHTAKKGLDSAEESLGGAKQQLTQIKQKFFIDQSGYAPVCSTISSTISADS